MIGLEAELREAAHRLKVASAEFIRAEEEVRRARAERNAAGSAWERLLDRLSDELAEPERTVDQAGNVGGHDVDPDAGATDCGHELVLDTAGRWYCAACDLGGQW